MDCGRKPAWLKVKTPAPGAFRATGAVIDDLRLHTVCDEARCPNKGECFSAGTATFLILGDVCTRGCGFCAVERGGASGQARGVGAATGETVSGGADRAAEAGRRAVDPDEPRRVAEAAARSRLPPTVSSPSCLCRVARGRLRGAAGPLEHSWWVMGPPPPPSEEE